MNQIDTYDPAQILVNYGGVDITGFATGTFVNIVKQGDNYTFVSGIGGEGIHVKAHNNFYIVTITLMQTSASNDYLSGIVQADDLLTGAGQLPLTVKNNLGREMFISSSAVIQRIADVSFSDSGSDARTWAFVAYGAQYWPGGSAT
jgi:hypothetical protein